MPEETQVLYLDFKDGTRHSCLVLPASRHGVIADKAIGRQNAMLLHGLLDNPLTFKTLAMDLSHQGFNVFMPTMRGNEQSSLSPGYSLSALVDDVFEWTTLLSLEKVHLVGHDLGSVVAGLCAVRDKHKINSLTMLNWPHNIKKGFLEQPLLLFSTSFLVYTALPMLPEAWLSAANARQALTWYYQSLSSSYAEDNMPVHFESVVNTLTQPGVAGAHLAYYRDLARSQALPVSLLSASELKSRALLDNAMTENVEVETFCIAGEEDSMIPIDWFQTSMSPIMFNNFGMGVTLKTLNTGHFSHLEDAANVGSFVAGAIAKRGYKQGVPRSPEDRKNDGLFSFSHCLPLL